MHPVGAMDDVIALVSEASKRVDQAERLELYTEALALIDDFVPMIVLFTINRVAAMRKEITFSGRPDFGIDLRAGNFSVA
jgi:ABC-type transport system substrate-binding protein